MCYETVAVFGATGQQGRAQVRELLARGHKPRAISRSPAAQESRGIEASWIAADYADPESLDRALAQVDAVFFQAPQLERPDRILAFAANVAQAARRADVGRIIVNSTMWVPDSPCGHPLYDMLLAVENLFTGLPTVIFRPTLYMDNWLTPFAKPALVSEHKYRYPHKPSLLMSPISLNDVAKFMVAALHDDDLVGQRLRIAGPQTLTPAQIAGELSIAIGTRIEHEYVTPREFGGFLYDLFGPALGVDRQSFVASFDQWYSFNNDTPQKPFSFDIGPTLRRIPVTLESFGAWASRQDWSAA